jgi:ribosomal protein L37AE/L43A
MKRVCPNCKKPMRLERETKTERIWVCDYCGMGSEISS